MHGKTTLLSLFVASLAALPVVQGAARITLPPAAQGGFADVVEQALPSVARVITDGAGSRGKASGEGAGVVVSADGYLLTNRHVIEGANKIVVQLSDDRELPAKVVAADGPTDIAVLKIEATGLRAIAFGDSGAARIGDYVLAIGNPFGVGTTVTLGIISAKGEADYIQTDAAINPGNSGGPLLNTRGELVGINTAIVSPSGGSSGVGFALPSNVARFVMSELMAKGHVDRGYLGAGLQPLTETLQEALGVTRGGALIADVAPGGPAAKAGLQKGDVVVALNGRALRNFQRLQLFAAQSKPADKLRVTVLRQGSETVVPVMLEERPLTAMAIVPEEVLSGAALMDSGAGPVVAVVDPDGASAAAGLRPGDVIVAVDKRAVAGMAAVREQLARADRKPVLLEVSRAGSTYFIAVPMM
jgi:serine protease Do